MSIFKLFKKKPKVEYVPLDLSHLKLDFHSHLLPELDDGVKSYSESVDIIKEFVKLGFQKLIITPHIMNDFYKNDIHVIGEKCSELKSILEQKGISIDLDYSAEYYFDEHFMDLYEKNEIRTFGNKHFLFELSYFNEPKNVREFVLRAKNDGFTPVLAHPERYPYWSDDLDVFRDLKASGCEFQININSLAGQYSEGPQRMAESFIESGLIDYLASDCHKMDHMRLSKRTKIKKHLNEMLLNNNMLKNESLF